MWTTPLLRTAAVIAGVSLSVVNGQSVLKDTPYPDYKALHEVIYNIDQAIATTLGIVQTVAKGDSTEPLVDAVKKIIDYTLGGYQTAKDQDVISAKELTGGETGDPAEGFLPQGVALEFLNLDSDVGGLASAFIAIAKTYVEPDSHCELTYYWAQQLYGSTQGLTSIIVPDKITHDFNDAYQQVSVAVVGEILGAIQNSLYAFGPGNCTDAGTPTDVVPTTSYTPTVSGTASQTGTTVTGTNTATQTGTDTTVTGTGTGTTVTGTGTGTATATATATGTGTTETQTTSCSETDTTTTQTTPCETDITTTETTPCETEITATESTPCETSTSYGSGNAPASGSTVTCTTLITQACSTCGNGGGGSSTGYPYSSVEYPPSGSAAPVSSVPNSAPAPPPESLPTGGAGPSTIPASSANTLTIHGAVLMAIGLWAMAL